MGTEHSLDQIATTANWGERMAPNARHTRTHRQADYYNTSFSAWARGGETHEITEHAAALVTTKQQMCTRVYAVPLNK